MTEALSANVLGTPVLPGALLLGVLPDLLRDPLTIYTQASQLGNLVRLPLPFADAYFVTSPALIQEVMQERATLFRRPPLLRKLLISLGGSNLMTLEGEPWLARRRLIQPYLRRASISALADEIVAAIDLSLDSWRSYTTLPLHEKLQELTQEIVARTLLGVSLKDVPGVGAAFATMTEYIAYRATNPFAPPFWLPTPRNLRMRRARRFLDEVATRIIKQRRTTPGVDLLSALLGARDSNGEALSDEALRREAQIIIGAGETTTSEALTFCFALLGEHPQVRERLIEQLDAVAGTRRVGLADLEHLPLLRQVIAETLRLYPPSYVLARAPIEDAQLGGIKLRKGTVVLFSPYTLHRDPRFWRDPESFRPERFDAHGAPIDVPRHAYLPFGAGPRRCVGEHLALLEMHLTVARILQRYQLDSPHAKVPTLKAGFALGLASELHIGLRERAHTDASAHVP